MLKRCSARVKYPKTESDFRTEGVQKYSHAKLSRVSPDWSLLNIARDKKSFQAGGTLPHSQSPQNAHINQSYTSFGFFSCSCYLKKESPQIRTIYNQPVKVPQGFAV